MSIYNMYIYIMYNIILYIYMYPWRFSEMGGTIIHPFIDGFSIVNKPFWGFPIYGNPHTYIIYIYTYTKIEWFIILAILGYTILLDTPKYHTKWVLHPTSKCPLYIPMMFHSSTINYKVSPPPVMFVGLQILWTTLW